MGSGQYLRFAQRKYGIENFEKQILGVYGSRLALEIAEAVLVDENYIERGDTYNISLGGNSGRGQSKQFSGEYLENLERNKRAKFIQDCEYNIEIVSVPVNNANKKRKPMSHMFTQFAIENPKYMVAVALQPKFRPEQRAKLISVLKKNVFVFKYGAKQQELFGNTKQFV